MNGGCPSGRGWRVHGHRSPSNRPGPTFRLKGGSGWVWGPEAQAVAQNTQSPGQPSKEGSLPAKGLGNLSRKGPAQPVSVKCRNPASSAKHGGRQSCLAAEAEKGTLNLTNTSFFPMAEEGCAQAEGQQAGVHMALTGCPKRSCEAQGDSLP